MKVVKPKVFLVGETRVVEDGLQDYLNHIGVPDWKTDAPSDSERLCEVMGRLCYRSFEPGIDDHCVAPRRAQGGPAWK